MPCIISASCDTTPCFPDAEGVVGLRQPQFLEEHVAHVVVVVLPGVQQPVLHVGVRRRHPAELGDFDDVRPGAYYRYYFHVSTSILT
jgi:hypothetical protein